MADTETTPKEVTEKSSETATAESSSAGDVQQQPSFDEDDMKNLDEIEKELAGSHIDRSDDDYSPSPSGNNSPTKTGGYVPAGAMPQQDGKLSQFAGEFWFPEARNCSCCKGFKHGCSCCAGGVTACQDPNCIDSAFASQVDQNLAARPPAPPSAAVAAVPISSGVPSPSGGGSAGGAGGGGGMMCKFEQSPGGCRFGASCRFTHTNGPTSGGSGLPSPSGPYSSYYGAPYGGSGASSPGGTKCIYFARGNCQYGESCRFAHVL